MACPDAVAPLQLPIANFSVTPDGVGIARGIQLGIGSPQQIVSLSPGISLANMYVWNSANCDASNISCVAIKGGVLNPKASSSFVQTTKAQWNGSQSIVDDEEFIYFNDVLRYGSTGESLGYPMTLLWPGYDGQSLLPMSRDSTFLKAVHDDNQAPSEAWGLWPGSTSVNEPQDGLLVVGGYDQSRVDGEWTTFPISEDCPGACVTVTNMTYSYEGVSQSLLPNSSQVIQVFLESYYPALDVPQPVFDAWASISNGTYDQNLRQLTYDINNAPRGNITVTLSNGFQTTIIASEHTQTPRTYNSDGVYSLTNETLAVSIIWNLTGPGDQMRGWGMPYLTMNYLIVDYRKREFKLAPSRREPYAWDGGPVISTICPAASESSGNTHRDTHVGAITGGVVGGVLGLALIIGGVGYLFWRKRSKSKSSPEMTDAPSERAKTELDGTQLRELHSSMGKKCWTPHNPQSAVMAREVGPLAELGTGEEHLKHDVDVNEAKELSASSEPTEVRSIVATPISFYSGS